MGLGNLGVRKFDNALKEFEIKNTDMRSYSFEKLGCWQHARQLAVWVYMITKNFPIAEKFGRYAKCAGLLYPLHLILLKVFPAKLQKTNHIFSTISYSSTIELLNDLRIANDLNFLTSELYSIGRERIEKQTLLIAGLRKSQQKSKFLGF